MAGKLLLSKTFIAFLIKATGVVFMLKLVIEIECVIKGLYFLFKYHSLHYLLHFSKQYYTTQMSFLWQKRKRKPNKLLQCCYFFKVAILLNWTLNLKQSNFIILIYVLNLYKHPHFTRKKCGNK